MVELFSPKLDVNMSETDQIFIGKKPVMNYVLACLTLFQNGSDILTSLNSLNISYYGIWYIEPLNP